MFFCRAEGWSMRDEGIRDGDVLLVDRAVVAAVHDELTVKRYVRRGDRVILLAANPDHAPIELHDGQELVVWGIVASHVGFHLPAGQGLRRVAA